MRRPSQRLRRDTAPINTLSVKSFYSTPTPPSKPTAKQDKKTYESTEVDSVKVHITQKSTKKSINVVEKISMSNTNSFSSKSQSPLDSSNSRKSSTSSISSSSSVSISTESSPTKDKFYDCNTTSSQSHISKAIVAPRKEESSEKTLMSNIEKLLNKIPSPVKPFLKKKTSRKDSNNFSDAPMTSTSSSSCSKKRKLAFNGKIFVEKIYDADNNDKQDGLENSRALDNGIPKIKKNNTPISTLDEISILSSSSDSDISDTDSDEQPNVHSDNKNIHADYLNKILKNSKKSSKKASENDQPFDIKSLQRKTGDIPNFIELDLPEIYDESIQKVHQFFQDEQEVIEQEIEEKKIENAEVKPTYNKKLVNFHEKPWDTENDVFVLCNKLSDIDVLDLSKFVHSIKHKDISQREMDEKLSYFRKWISQNKDDSLKILKIVTIYALDYELDEVKSFKSSVFQINKHVLESVPSMRNLSRLDKDTQESYFNYISNLNEFHQFRILQKNQFLRRMFFQHQYDNDCIKWMRKLGDTLDMEKEANSPYKGASLYEFLKFVTLMNLPILQNLQSFLLKDCRDSFSTNNVENALLKQYLNVYIQKHSYMEEKHHSLMDYDDDAEDD